MTSDAGLASAAKVASCAPFDPLAEDYDASFTRSWLGRTLRSVVWGRLDAMFHAGDRVLELGCGTGEDALRLADRGVAVLATDASAGMIDVARRKATARGQAGRVDFRHLPLECIGSALAGERFDGVLADFGVVNCAADLAALTSTVADLLSPGGRLMWVVMGPLVPWEWAWYLARGDVGRARRRLRRGGVRWRDLTVRYPSPRRLRSILRARFVVDRIWPLGIVLPPSYAAGWLARAPKTAAAMAAVERSLRRMTALSFIADHYVVEARVAPAVTP